MKSSTQKLTRAAIMTALVFIATRFTQFPVGPLGYVHAGDALVLLCAFIPGGSIGVCAAGFGSMLADLTSGYTIYALPTLLIKAAMCACVLPAAKQRKPLSVRVFIHMIAGGGVMMLGYFIFDYFIMGLRELSAIQMLIVSWPQAVFGIIAAFFLRGAMVKSKIL